MARLEFNRIDVPLNIGPEGSAEAGIQISSGKSSTDILIDQPRLLQWIGSELNIRRNEPRDGQTIRRLTLNIRHKPLHALPWESRLKVALTELPLDVIVRVSPVIPRVSQTTFTPPLRALFCDSPDAQDTLNHIRRLLDDRTETDIDSVFRGASIRLADIKDPDAAPHGWPVVDIVHLGKIPLDPNDTQWLSPSLNTFGSLGWLSRLLDAWQTRLLIIDASRQEIARARQLAAGIVARGGPAALVRDPRSPVDSLYERLIRDTPLDHPSISHGPIDCLFGGAKREELVRISNTAVAAVVVQQSIPTSQGYVAEHHEEPTRVATPVAPALQRTLRIDRIANDYLGAFAALAPGLLYHLPQSGAIRAIIDTVGGIRGRLPRATPRPKPGARRKRRYVNGSLWHEANGEPEAVDAISERLLLEQLYQLRIDIGARNRDIPTYGPSVFQEIPKTAADSGEWVEIVVNGVGFEIEGDAVQALWVPTEGPTDAVWFAVRPVREPLAVLRYTIYYRQNVVQTFRLAALTQQQDATSPNTPSEDARLLADALNIPIAGARKKMQLTRLEYAAATLNGLTDLPPREVAIVANHVGDERVITVKGETYQFDNTTPGIDSPASLARAKLFDGSVYKEDPQNPLSWIYRFQHPDANPQVLREILPELALKGWALYDDAFPKDERDALEQDLDRVDAKIVVAHTLLEDVIPWALMYDRLYTQNVAPGSRLEVCLAALPDAQGKLPFASCGDPRTKCVLSDKTLDERNVACPLRFWGFRHLIELPPRQQPGPIPEPDVTAKAQTPEETANAPAAIAAPLQLAAAVNAALRNAQTHVQDLQTMKTQRGTSVQWAKLEEDPTLALTAVQLSNLDLAYLYCHARGGIEDPQRTRPPIIEFTRGSETRSYKSNEIQVVWKRNPLVILNGCSTAAFSVDALSPFVKKFTRDCKAGGVIGTEIPVHEKLAADVVYRLLMRILDGDPVGTSLLTIRRILLSECNPMGLAYTLYGTTEFKIGGA